VNASEKAAATRAARQPIPVPGTPDYTAYRGSLRPSTPALEPETVAEPNDDRRTEMVFDLWQTGVQDTVDISEATGFSEADVCSLLHELREAGR